MSKRLTRKQIKEDIRHDEVQEALTSTIDKLLENKQLVIGGAVAIVVLAVGFAGFRIFLESRAQGATAALSDAMKVYAAPIVEDGAQPDDPKAPSFASEAERRERARERLAEVDAGVAGDVAELFLAQIALAEGDAEKTRTAWEAFLRDQGEDHMLSASVRLSLLRLERDQGEGEKVLTWLESELARAEKGLPEDVLLFETAKTLEALERSDEADEYYQRILDDHPTSTFVTQAREATAS